MMQLIKIILLQEAVLEMNFDVKKKRQIVSVVKNYVMDIKIVTMMLMRTDVVSKIFHKSLISFFLVF